MMTMVGVVALVHTAVDAARADLYDYTFGTSASGQFTTGGASPTDPGYFLVQSLTVTSFTDDFLGPLSPVSVSATQFADGAAFNPSTGAFISHLGGIVNENDIGITSATGPIGSDSVFGIIGTSFASGSSSLEIDGHRALYTASGVLSIVPAVVPEPSTAIVVVFGAVAFLAYGWSRHRRDQRRQAAA
jgi:hypothetical protein